MQTLEPRRMMASAAQLDSQYLRFFLADTTTNQPIAEVTSRHPIDASLIQDRDVTIYAVPRDGVDSDDIGRVRMRVPRVGQRNERVAPYALFGDRNGDFGGDWRPDAGTYELDVRVYDSNQRRRVLETVDLEFQIRDDPKTRIIDVTQLPQDVTSRFPEVQHAIPNDSMDDGPAIRAAINVLTTQLESDQLDSATVYLPPGVFDVGESIVVNEKITLLGAGAEATTLTHTDAFAFDGTDITDTDVRLNNVNRAGYLVDFDRNADGAALRGMTLTGPNAIGGVFSHDADLLDISGTRFQTFLWSGLRSFNLDDATIFDNVFVDAGGRKVRDDGSFGVTGGAMFLTFNVDAEVSHNIFKRVDPDHPNMFGVKGRKWTNSRIHHNTIETNFSIELPFENDAGVEIDHNDLRGVVSVPKFAGGPALESGESFRIHHNTFSKSYSIEGARNGILIEKNVFEFDARDDGGNLMVDFGRVYVPGPLTFRENLVINPGRGIYSGGGVHDRITFENNHIAASQTITPRDGAMFAFRTGDNEGNQTDFETIRIVDNRIEIRDLERPLVNTDAAGQAVIENNSLSGISDLQRYANPVADRSTGLSEPLRFVVGAGLGRAIDSDDVLQRFRDAQRPVTMDTDGDGIRDNLDPAPEDAANGTSRVLTAGEDIVLEFDQPNGTPPLDAASGLTGINIDPDAIDAFYADDPYGVLTGEAAEIRDGLLQVLTGNGDSFNQNNASSDDYGLMINASQVDAFEVSSVIVLPEGGLPQAPSAAVGLQIGTGTQQSYIKLTRSYGGGGNRIEVRWDNADDQADARPGNSAKAQSISLDVLQAAAPRFRLTLAIDRSDADRPIVTPHAQALDANNQDVGDTITGVPFAISGEVVDAINAQGSELGGNTPSGLFVGVYSTDFSNPFNRVPSFRAAWDDLRIQAISPADGD